MIFSTSDTGGQVVNFRCFYRCLNPVTHFCKHCGTWFCESGAARHDAIMRLAKRPERATLLPLSGTLTATITSTVNKETPDSEAGKESGS